MIFYIQGRKRDLVSHLSFSRITHIVGKITLQHPVKLSQLGHI